MQTDNYNESTTSIPLSREAGRELKKSLRIKLEEAGCFKPTPVYHSLHILALTALYTWAYLVLLTDSPLYIHILALILVAFTNVQSGLIAHEVGHGAVTKKKRLADLLGQFLFSFLTGVCYSHFQRIHTRHHAHTNERALDYDMQSSIVSLYPESVSDKQSAYSRFITRHQAYLIWPLISLQGFTLKLDSLATLYNNPKETRLDQIALILHWILWLVIPSIVVGINIALLNYFFITWLIGPYTGYIFLVNHIGTYVVQPDDNLSSLQQQTMTTRNLEQGIFFDLLYGGINNHIEHHLFPSIPSMRLHKARQITRGFCQQHGLIYREMNWMQAAREVFDFLQTVSQRLQSKI